MATPGVLAKKPGSTRDPLWFKDAVIYELHVRAFYDANNDGIGDFQGLLQKLDYIQDLGVTCIWLLPFFPSPLRDDGYDISDYMDVHPNYGTLDEFRQFLDAAHDRGLQVMIELVINHTSDQHPWFQAARLAPPGSPEREFYVWSDTDEKYKDARIIFTDTEKSNWTWDPAAKAYYWHRFFSHQPDLNFDNPHVLEEVLHIMRFWLDMGVDALRTDAIPYLVERDGTNCENLPETHAIIKRIRKEIDEHYENRVILAEANQWPTDVRPYFGNGDECHMAFHFPLMPRIYMALRQEDRLPITDIMSQTPDIPENCQWGLFLRNHDELTLEMVTDDERDYMYLAYSADPRMRINIGIRRRLAPLVDNNRRRIELLNSLLFSFPGTPIIYYGDELGMGDNIYLGDRNGVRTPMQWSGDRNAGFSRATPGKLYSPVVMDPVWGYEAINVEAQQSDPSSLLNWMRNMLALRKIFSVFGRGKLVFLHPTNRKVLAYLRENESETILCVANLSRFAQPVQLDLAAYEGMTPVEMLGYVDFPQITKQQYPLTLAPYGFMWLELHASDPPSETVASENLGGVDSNVHLPASWRSFFSGRSLEKLQLEVLPRFLSSQRWFSGKAERLASSRVLDWGEIADGTSIFCAIEVVFESGRTEEYVVPLSIEDLAAAKVIAEKHPEAIVTTVVTEDGDMATLCDGTYNRAMQAAWLEMLTGDGGVDLQRGKLRGVAGKIAAELRDEIVNVEPQHSSAEQSNTSILYGDKAILKVFRRPEAGLNPDVEIGRFLSDEAGFDRVAPFVGSLQYVRDGVEITVAMAQRLVKNEGDGWTWMLEELDRFYETAAIEGSLRRDLIAQTAALVTRANAVVARDAAAILGQRTAELHVALSTGPALSDEAFLPEPMTQESLAELSKKITEDSARAIGALRANLSHLPDESIEEAGLLLSRRAVLMQQIGPAPKPSKIGMRTRVHGDYHLGQVLRTKADFVILDFEGEPARSLAERREKESPLKDVAGMVRSFSYAAYASLMHYSSRRPEDFARLQPIADEWQKQIVQAFLHAYRQRVAGHEIVPESEADFSALLRLFLWQKVNYELLYELNNRPAWVRIPMAGMLDLMRQQSEGGTDGGS